MTAENVNPSTPADFVSFVKKWGIGLTGGIATGKSTVSHMLSARGYEVIDADDLARQAVKPGSACLNAIVDHFGREVLAGDGTLNRKALSTIVFSNTEKRKALEAIIHPEIQRLFKARVEKLGLLSREQPFFYEAALLFESGRTDVFAQIWATVCSEETQTQRLKHSRKLDEATALALLASQWPAIEKAKKADVVINTDCAVPDVELQVANMLRQLPLHQKPR